MDGKAVRASMRTSRAGMNDGLPSRGAMTPVESNIVARRHDGFTLVELVVVIAIISILFMIAVPRITRIFTTQREHFAVLTGVIVKSFDDAFLHDRTNYLTLYLKSPGSVDNADAEDEAHRNNGFAVKVMGDGVMTDHRLKSLRFRSFSEDFIIEEVILQAGGKYTEGRVIIPFYPQGYSDNAIIHILVNGYQQWSVRIDKHIKEPKVIEGYKGYEEETI